MKCPNCGADGGFHEHADFSVCSQTGYVQGVWLTCDSCGAETDYAEIDRISKDGRFDGDEPEPEEPVI
jgi:hypothetical protein